MQDVAGRSKQKMRRVAFYGGSFDPPHRAHLAVARAARAALDLDCVLFAPVGSQPLKPGGGSASFADRAEMIRLAIAGEVGFELSFLDAPQTAGQPNFTIDSLRKLSSEVGSGSDLFCLMGADSLANLRLWREASEIPFAATLVVAARPGVELSSLQPLLPNGINVRATPAHELSSSGIELLQAGLVDRQGRTAKLILLPGLEDPTNATDLRNLLHTGSSQAASLLPDAVLDYIRTHDLYL